MLGSARCATRSAPASVPPADYGRRSASAASAQLGLVTRLGLVRRVDAHSARFDALPKSSRRISGQSLSGMSDSAAKVVASTSSSPWGQPPSVGLQRHGVHGNACHPEPLNVPWENAHGSALTCLAH